MTAITKQRQPIVFETWLFAATLLPCKIAKCSVNQQTQDMRHVKFSALLYTTAERGRQASQLNDLAMALSRGANIFAR
jgi:hypothetical protein